MNRATAKYLACLAVVAALFDWKTFLTSQYTLLAGPESVDYTYSWLHFWINSLRHGHVPLWDPYAFGGRPFAAEMLPSAYYPLHLPLLLIPFNQDGLLAPEFYNGLFFFNHLLSLCFTFALLRELGLRRFASLVGACCFSLSGLLANLPWPPFLEAAIWLPAIFLFLLRALRAEEVRKAILEAALSGLCLGMSILTGGLHFSMMQGILVLSAVLYYGGSTETLGGLTRAAHWRRASLILAVIVVVGLAAGAVQLLPALEYGKLSMRYIDGGIFPATEKIPYNRLHPGMWPQSIVTTLIPFAYGGQTGGSASENWGSYIGVFPFFLAIIAIWKSWNRLWVRYLTGLAVLAFAYTLREFSPLHGWLYALIPYLWVIRQPSRFVYLVSFALALLAAFGLETLLDGTVRQDSWKPARQILRWVAIASAVTLFAAGMFNLNLNTWVCLSLLIVVASCVWFFYLTANRSGPSARVLLAGFILLDLTAFHWSELNRSAPSHPDQRLAQVTSLRSVAGFIKMQPGLGRVRVAVFPEPNIGDLYGVQNVSGGGGTILTSYARLSLHPDLLNVRYLVKPASAADPGPIYQDEHWKVYELSTAYPRAWLVHKTMVEGSQAAALQRIDDPGINLHNVALLEAPLPEVLQETTGAPEETRIMSYGADRFRLEVDAGGAGLVVLSEMYYPGWRATVNGRPTPIVRVDGGLRGIPVPRGRSRIQLKYIPISFYTGGVFSLLAFGIVLIALPWTWRKSGVFQKDARGLQKEAEQRSESNSNIIGT